MILVSWEFFFKRRRTTLEKWVESYGFKSTGEVQQQLALMGVTEPPLALIQSALMPSVPDEPPIPVPQKKPTRKPRRNSKKTTSRTKKKSE